MIPHFSTYFPPQRVGYTEKEKPSWYANCIDYIVDLGISLNDRSEDEVKLNILHGDIPNSFYKKTLNPYNSSQEKYKRFPATMRNFDIMSDIVRRFVSEYYKGIHEFIASANNPDIVLRRNAKLNKEIMIMAEQAFQQELEKLMQQIQGQVQEDPNANPQELLQQQMPDVEKFVENFKDKYIDDESKQAQDMLGFIRSVTQDAIVYLSAFFNYVALGECFTYSEINGDKIIKENVPVIEAFPIPNNNFFVEDHDMFARKIMLSYQQIIDMFDNYLSDKDREYLEKYYANREHSSKTKFLYNQYFEYYPEVCEKFSKEEREFFRKNSISPYDENSNLFEVWHVVWRGEARKGVVTYVNEIGFETTKIVDETYELNPEAGDIKVEWEYEPQVYEGYRIGNRSSAIYPIKARPIAYQRDGKLPYNGIMEVLPMMGKFSIIKLITPYQIMRNIFIYHREMVIAKNKMLILLLPQSLVAEDAEDRIYKMAADGTLLIDDSEDSNSQKAAQVRLLNANMGEYIRQMTELIEIVKQAAREVVDMNMQRYGEIAQSAGAATTQEAVARSSMGSVIITEVFDQMRARDYTRDLDFAKLAYIDGLDTTYYDELRKKRYLSLDVNSYLYCQLGVVVKNDAKEIDKLNQLKQWAFSAAQNGDLQMAKEAIIGDNITQISAAIDKFDEIKRQHEEQMQQMEQIIKQEELQNKIAEIQAKGEEDRKTQELKYQYELQLKYLDVDMSMLSTGVQDDYLGQAKQRLAEQTAANKERLDADKLNFEKQKLQIDMYNKAADRQVKREDIDAKVKIAKQNKNKYDK